MSTELSRRPPLSLPTLRALCLLTAVANIGGNVVLVIAYPILFPWLGIEAPQDLRLFLLESALSFSMGVLAWMVFCARHEPKRALPLLKIGTLGKGLYALIGYYFFATQGLHWFYMIFVVWDALFVVVFLLYWIALESRDLWALQRDVLTGIARPRPEQPKALVVGYSLTGAGRTAIDRLKIGLLAGGYDRVDIRYVHALESFYRFPMSFVDFVRMLIRAFFRKSPPVGPLGDLAGDYDLIVVESPTWLLGMAAPMEGLFEDSTQTEMFRGTDTAALVVSRGAQRRSLAMLTRWLQRCDANVVGIRGYGHQGKEPRRLLSLWLYLIFRKEGVPRGIAQPYYGLSEASLREIEAFGTALARRGRTRPHFTLASSVVGSEDAAHAS
ncbi:MAG: hypothetical protein V3V08_14980 [Nannocystaceae bacterium]